MTSTEFSNKFDTLVNSYRRFKDFDDKELFDSIEFNEYEKSLFLTEAQDEYVLSLYNGRNPLQESFEQTEELRRYLANLVCEAELTPIVNSSGVSLGSGTKKTYFSLPNGENNIPAAMFITYEEVVLSDSEDNGCRASVIDPTTGDITKRSVMEVVPVTQDEYHKLRKNPFRGANNRRALRLDLSESNVEIICKYDVRSYYIKYIREPKPIILEDLPDGLTIKREYKETKNGCELHPFLHDRILELAVRKALLSKLGSKQDK